MEIYTIGFTKRSAEEFFRTLGEARVKRLIDIRLNNTSQLAGFAKQDDLRFFLETILGIEYLHEPALAPTSELLKGYRKSELSWEEYKQRFLKLIEQRKIEETLERSVFEGAALLCSERTPERCHRRLVAEYLQERWPDVSVQHL